MEIETSARLHLSLIDLNGLEGRIDGGIGITLKDPLLSIECNETSDNTKIEFDDNLNLLHKQIYEKKILDAYDKIKKHLNITNNYHFKVNEMYPLHQGLGLGSQLALSVSKLVSSLNNINLSSYELAEIIHRGGTSGIGVHSFDNGGLIIDGGHKKSIKQDYLPSSASKVSPPPLIARYDFPKDWDIILVTPKISEGASGKKEVDIFQSYTPINIDDVQKICHLTLMKLMPSIVEKDLDCFGDAVNKIQLLGFKKIERNLQDNKINELLVNMENMDIPCVGMSSFGPTCFGIVDTNSKSIMKEIGNFMDNNAKIRSTKGKNHGAILKNR